MIKLIADSTCDLSANLIDKYDIGIAPLSITIGQKNYLDRIDLTPDEFYKRLPGLPASPSTAMPSPHAFYELMRLAYEEGKKEILVITMSSGTSGSYQSAKIAMEDFLDDYPQAKVHVVDSKCMSHGSGYLLLKSGRLIDQGASFEELISFNETYKMNVKHFLAVEDLDNLIRSGRLTNASAFIGKILKINPIMSMRNGKGAIVAKVRSQRKVLSHYIKEFGIRNDPSLTDFVIIGYTDKISIAKELKEKFIVETGFEGEVFIQQMGVAVGTHVGLGGISMFFMEKGDRHDGLFFNELQELLDKKEEFTKRLKELRQRSK